MSKLKPGRAQSLRPAVKSLIRPPARLYLATSPFIVCLPYRVRKTNTGVKVLA
jgi:hypothetical protein